VSQALDEIKIGGLGASRKRVEDSRFIRGRGNYTDDITLPGMLHMEILRSPLAHARIVSIDASKAWDIPGVHLVLTGEMMATRNLAWMPTLSYDTQAVLATDKVRFQGPASSPTTRTSPRTRARPSRSSTSRCRSSSTRSRRSPRAPR